MEESNFQFHYDEATVRIVAFSKFHPSLAPNYSTRLFAEDWVKNKLIDWEKYLVILLDRTTDCISTYEKHLDGYEKIKRLPPSVLPPKKILQDFGITSDKENAKFRSKCQLALNNIELLKDFQENIQECIEFYDVNKDLPPFSEKFSLKEQIPFWGSQDEFSLMIHLLTNCDFILTKKSGTRDNFPEKYTIEILKQFETYASRKKTDITSLFCQYFVGITVNKDKIIETKFNPATVVGRLNNTRLSELSTDFFLDRYEILKNHFEKIKDSKETPSHMTSNAKQEKKRTDTF